MASGSRLTELAHSVVNGERSPYDRALAATALGRELRAVRSKEHGYKIPKARGIEDALLELVGYACRQQQLWLAWAQALPKNQKLHSALQLPPGADITLEDAKKIRENCAAVLAILLSRQRNEALPPLRDLSKTPESLSLSANLVRQSLQQGDNGSRSTVTLLHSENKNAIQRIEQSSGAAKMHPVSPSDPLKLIHSAASLEADVEQRVNAALAAPRIQEEENALFPQPTAALAAYLKKLETTTSNQESSSRQSSHGYLRTISGDYRRPREPLSSRHRPAVLYLSDTEPPAEIAGLGEVQVADQRLGYPTSRIVVSNKRPSLPPSGNFGLSPRAGGDATLRAMRPVTTDTILQEHASINALATYASTVVKDPRHPRARTFRAAFAASHNRFDRSVKKLLPILHAQIEPLEVEDDDSAEPILDRPHPIVPVSPKDVRRLIAWSPGRGTAPAKDTVKSSDVAPVSPDRQTSRKKNSDININNKTAKLAFQRNSDDDNYTAVVHARADQKVPLCNNVNEEALDAKLAWRDSRREAILSISANFADEDKIESNSAATKLAAALSKPQVENQALPLTMLARFGSSSCDPDQRLHSAIAVRGRLQRIFSRWIEEFERAQLTAALALWRIAKLQSLREETRIMYRQKAAVSKLQTFLSHRRRVRIARAFAKLVSRTAWLMFYERDGAALRIQTAHRRIRTLKLFLARHDAMPIGGVYFSDIYLAPERRSRRVKFKIDARVRLERRKAWGAATMLQNRYRRTLLRRHYMHIRSTAIKFEATLRMWPIRALYIIKRRRAIAVSATIRMYLCRDFFLRTCAAVRKAQRVIRGHSGRSAAYRALNRRRHEMELKATAPRIIQNLWRGFLGRKKVAEMRADIRALHWAGLKLQCAWYKNRGAFPTFLLLSCLRVSDIEDREFATEVRLNARRLAQRRLVARFRGHRAARHRDAAKSIAACWRRFVSYQLVLGLRQSKWARRRIQSFVRACMKLRHAASRKIQFMWLRASPGRFLRHLEGAITREEKALDQIEKYKRAIAATTIQAIIHGQCTRRQLRRKAAIVLLQGRARLKLAYLAVERRYAQLRSHFTAQIVQRVTRTSLFTLLNAYRQKLRTSAIRIQALVRSSLLRCAIMRAWRRARRLTWAAITVQRATRRRAGHLTAMANIGLMQRSNVSVFRACETFHEVLILLSRYAEIPESQKHAWLWFDSKNLWAGVGPHTVCRRSGCAASVSYLDNKVMSLKALAQQQLKTSEKEDHLLNNAILLARALLAGEPAHIVDDSIPLDDNQTRYIAAFYVCASQFAEISKRKIESLESRNDILSVVKFDKLPFPCRKLITALSEDGLFSSDLIPLDLSLKMLNSICEHYADPDRVLRALKNQELKKSPWLPSASEVAHNKARIQRAYERRRDALERLQELLKMRDPNQTTRSLLSVVILDAISVGKAAVHLAERRAEKAAKRLRKRNHADMSKCHRDDVPTASTCARSAEIALLDSKIRVKPNIAGYLQEFDLDRPGILGRMDLKEIFTMLPGIENCEQSIAFVVANEVYTEALQKLEVYQRAVGRVSAALKMRLSRRMTSTLRHARAVAQVQSTYLYERSGQAVKAVWKADMKKYAEEKAIEEQECLALKRRQETQNRLWYVLRNGWRQIQIRLGQLEMSLRDNELKDLELNTTVTVYERIRPPLPKSIHRSGQKIDPKFRDDDSARDPDVPRIVVAAQSGDSIWECRERERQRLRPLYNSDDDSASIVLQTLIRGRLTRKRISKCRRDEVRTAREQREYEKWKARHAERLRHVTMRMTIEPEEIASTIISEMQDDTTTIIEDSMDPRGVSPFESTEFCAFERGLHVLARFDGIGHEHWYPGTIFDAERKDVFGVMFDDGDVDTDVKKMDIRVPRITIGLRVEALYKAKNELYEATIISLEPDATYTVRYDDGEIEEHMDRTRLRIVNAESLLQAESKHLDYLRTRRATQLREKMRVQRHNRSALQHQRSMDLLRGRFNEARSLFVPEEMYRQHQERTLSDSRVDTHALALSEMAQCLKDLETSSTPQLGIKLRIEYTKVSLRFGWREISDVNGETYFANSLGQTTWDFPSYTFEEELAARHFQRCFRRAIRRREMDLTLGSAHLPKLIQDTRSAAIRLAWTPQGSAADTLNDRIPLELWMARRGFGRAAIASVMRVVTKQANKLAAVAMTSRLSQSKLKLERQNCLDRAKLRMLQRLQQLSGAGIAASEEMTTSMERASLSDATNTSTAKRAIADQIRRQQVKEEEQLESYGLLTFADRQWLRMTTDAVGRFVAYWDSSFDERDMLQVLKNAKEAYINEFEKVYKNQRSRCEHMAESLMESRFPVTIGQIHRIAFDFPGKPAAAQEVVHARIVDLPTTSIQEDELEALRIFVAGATRAKQLCERMHLHTLVQIAKSTIDQSNNICAPPVHKPSGTSNAICALQRVIQERKDSEKVTEKKSSGAAARACWMLDDKIFGSILTIWHGIVLLQKHTRRRASRRMYLELRARRQCAAIQCQSAWRKGLARRMAALFRLQQNARIHMLWDDSVEAFYFLDVETSEVSWEEPAGGKWAYRPQVRDRFTGRFMLAWPQLDRPKSLHAREPKEGKCMLCKTEESTRACLSCKAPKFDGNAPSWGDGFYQFCFSCFASYHNPSPILRAHEFVVTKEVSAPSLACCVCASPATRRCRGLVLQARGREILHKFFVQGVASSTDSEHTSSWEFITSSSLRNVLRQAGLPLSLQRVDDMHTSCKGSVDFADEESKQVASYRVALFSKLDGLAAECHDFYCAECWSSTHAKGSRLRHCWSGFSPGAPACALCENAIASLKCETCGDFLCEDCSKAAHSKGKNLEHVQTTLRERLDENDKTSRYCKECTVRFGSESCQLCAAHLCDSCHLFVHPTKCEKRSGAKAIAIGIDIDCPTTCAVCGRKPDTRCLECDEVYCTWMGKPRCFAKHHAKGKRRSHTLVPYTAMADIERHLQEEAEADKRRTEALEVERAKTAAEFERACEEARRAKEEEADLIDKKAEELLAEHILNERLARRQQKISPQEWLYSVMSQTWRFAQQRRSNTLFSS